MDVCNQHPEMSIRFNPNPAKRPLKQGACALVHLIESAGISIEKVGKCLAGRFFNRFIFDANRKMEMIAEQAVGKGFRNGFNMVGIQFHEIMIVPFFDKQVFPVIPAIVDMVILAGDEGWRIHGRTPDRFF